MNSCVYSKKKDELTPDLGGREAKLSDRTRTWKFVGCKTKLRTPKLKFEKLDDVFKLGVFCLKHSLYCHSTKLIAA